MSVASIHAAKCGGHYSYFTFKDAVSHAHFSTVKRETNYNDAKGLKTVGYDYLASAERERSVVVGPWQSDLVKRTPELVYAYNLVLEVCSREKSASEENKRLQAIKDKEKEKEGHEGKEGAGGEEAGKAASKGKGKAKAKGKGKGKGKGKTKAEPAKVSEVEEKEDDHKKGEQEQKKPDEAAKPASNDGNTSKPISSSTTATQTSSAAAPVKAEVGKTEKKPEVAASAKLFEMEMKVQSDRIEFDKEFRFSCSHNLSCNPSAYGNVNWDSASGKLLRTWDETVGVL